MPSYTAVLWLFLGFLSSIPLVHIFYLGPITGHMKSYFTSGSVEKRSKAGDTLLYFKFRFLHK